MTPAELRRLIEASGLTVRHFSRDVMSRDERTVARWLSGEIEIPAAAGRWLARLESVHRLRDGRVRITVRPA